MPNLAALKDFLRFLASMMQDKIEERATDESLNSFADWFFTEFTRVTETMIGENERSDVYNISSQRILEETFRRRGPCEKAKE